MKPAPGTYALILRSDTNRQTQVGRWGILDIHPGYYLYVGSAFGPGGLLARVARHCREDKPKHWHIDYLRELTTPTSIWYSYGPDRFEHDWAKTLAGMPDMLPVIGFGCSDCSCEAHLFFSARKPKLTDFTRAIQGSTAVLETKPLP